MNQPVLKSIVEKALARTITFPEILATMQKEGVESYHVDFLRNEYRFYSQGGDSFVMEVPLLHGEIALEFSTEKLEAVNKRVQGGQAGYPDFVSEGAAAGCAYYIVYLAGKKVRYFGRNGGEYIQHFPGSR